MNMRTKGIGKMDKVVITLHEHYTEFEAEFTSFFEEMFRFSNQKLREL